MWLLVVACMAGPAGPECGSALRPVQDRRVEACADAAVLSHDQIRARAKEAGLTLLLLDTRCLGRSEEERP
jgi:hypothetical protein